jgi:Fe-S cluster assembly scaffold protein SufB
MAAIVGTEGKKVTSDWPKGEGTGKHSLGNVRSLARNGLKVPMGFPKLMCPLNED